jgi:hypothetical protein
VSYELVELACSLYDRRGELTDRFLVVGAIYAIYARVPAATRRYPNLLAAHRAELAHHVRMFCVNHPVTF